MDALIKTFDLKELLDENSHSYRKKLDIAFQDMGFIIIKNHEINQDLIVKLYSMMKDFFRLPLSEKTKYKSEDLKSRGYLPIGIESVSATLNEQAPYDVCEALEFCSHGKEIILPVEIPGLKEVINKYNAEINRVGRDLLHIFSQTMGFKEDIFIESYTNPRLNLRFVRYPEQGKIELRKNQQRYGAHHDYGGITILKTDNAIGGLQVSDKMGCWYELICPEEGYIVNCGDLLSYWTGNRWRSALHRVANPPTGMTRGTDRLSMVAFFDPNEDAVIHPIGSQATQTVIAGEYIDNKINRSMV